MRLTRLRLFVATALTVVVAAATVGVMSVTAHAAVACNVTYRVANQWQGGFQGDVTVQNPGDAWTSWTLRFDFANGQRITQLWSARLTSPGPTGVVINNEAWNGNISTGGSATFGFIASWSGANTAPTTFTVNGVACNGGPQPTTATTTRPTTQATTAPTTRPTTAPTTRATTAPTTGPTGGSANSMGFIGCSMAENVAQGYVAVGGRRMWGPYGTGGLVVQSWTDTNSSAWQKFDQQSARFGRPMAVWVQICIFAQNGATYDEVKRLIANARQHAAAGATIIISGQPLYDAGQTCTLAGANGPQLTDNLARQAAADSTQNVTYPGQFRLRNGEVADGCHANTTGQQSLGRQAIGYWG